MTDKINYVYKPTYSVVKTGYAHEFGSSGVEIEWFGFYRADEHILSNQPTHADIFKKITKLLKGSGISKLTVTFLDKNL